jgi:glycosyltransferase involved in cell wall biosynthesis
VLNGAAPKIPELEATVTTVVREPVPGVSRARNTGLRHARGDYIVVTDDDVLMGPEWLHGLLQGFSSLDVACVTGRLAAEGAGYLSDTEYGTARATSSWILDRSDPDWFARSISSDTGLGCNMAFRRSFLERCGFPEELGAGAVIGSGDEHYLFLQAVKSGYKLCHISDDAARVTHIFSGDPNGLRMRMRQLNASSMAFHLKLLLQEPELRGAVLRKVWSSAYRHLRELGGHQRPRYRPVLSPGERMRSFASGIKLFLRSQR